MVDDQIVQVTSSSVRLIDSYTHQLITDWSPPSGNNIVVAAGSPSQVLVATAGKSISYLEVGKQSLTETASVNLSAEASCLDISPIGAQ